MVLKALQTMAGVLPAEWRPYIDLLFSIVGSASVLVFTVKGALRLLPVPNAPDPKAGRWQWVSYWLIYLAEIPALSFLKPVGVSAAEVQRSKKFKIPPPMPLLAFALAFASLGCTTPPPVNAKAAQASDEVYEVLEDVGGTLLERCAAGEALVLEHARTKADAFAGLALVRAECDPMFADYEAARVAQVALAEAIESGGPYAEKALALLAAWQGLNERAAARPRGVILANPPEALHALIRGAL